MEMCSGRLPVELSSSIKALAIDCPIRKKCLRWCINEERPIDLYYNRFSHECGSFIEMKGGVWE
jgi:hypothetical protein